MKLSFILQEVAIMRTLWILCGHKGMDMDSNSTQVAKVMLDWLYGDQSVLRKVHPTIKLHRPGCRYKALCEILTLK